MEAKVKEKITSRIVKTAGSSVIDNVDGDSAKQLAHHVGEALTKTTGTGGYMASYLKVLQEYPLRTKMLTGGALAGLQEVIASWMAHDLSKHGHYFSSRVPKMALYGAFVSAPLGHFLIHLLQKGFAHRKSLKAKITMILVSNLVISPIQNVVYLLSMAFVVGARDRHQYYATLRHGLMKVMKVSWITSPICLAFAQQFLPEHAWVPFFNVVAFVIGIYINSYSKKKRIRALRRKEFRNRADGRSSSSSSSDEQNQKRSHNH